MNGSSLRSLAALILVSIIPAGVRAQSASDCLLCHSDHGLTMRRNGRTVSLYVDAGRLQSSAHASLECVDCHQGLNAQEIPHAKVIRPVNCLNCHEADGYGSSIHAQAVPSQQQEEEHPAAACKECHGTHDILAPSNPRSTVNRAHLSETCGKCHETQSTDFVASAHGAALARGIKGSPDCADCHGSHNIEPITSRLSPVYKQHEAEVCLRCHIGNPQVQALVGMSAGFIAGYMNSIHGLQVAAGNQKAAVCSDCHGAHTMLAASNPHSHVNKLNIPHTCGRCHSSIAGVYGQSIHGTSLRKGNLDAPACTDCHGQHQILAPQNPLSRVAPANVSAMVCGACHGSVQLASRYNLPAERLTTFENSYHGLAAREGAISVANCASCHGHHDIKPSSDPTSSINKANLPKTCGKCHPGATQAFAQGPIHIELAPSGPAAILYWIRSVYIGLIAVVVGGMFIHNAFDFVRKSKRHLAVRRQGPSDAGSLYLRMSLSERWQHGVLFASFSVLVFTGFMLQFPDAWWVAPIRRFTPKLFEVRSITHRVAGVLLIGSAFYHVCYLIAVRRGRRLIRDLFPKLQDLRDAGRLILYNAGISKSRPRFGRFGYIEKIEYWALVWGTAVMGATGIILWFNTFFIDRLTLLGWNAARLIHYYEAWLATLAILVWHFYFVIFSPDVYPMNMAWLDGMLSEEEMAEEHPLELEQIRGRDLEGPDEEGPSPGV